MILILNLEVHRQDNLSALRIPVTITQRLSSDAKTVNPMTICNTLFANVKVLTTCTKMYT